MSLSAIAAGPSASTKGGRLTRAAVLFASATAVASCGSTDKDDGLAPVPAYGVPVIDSGAKDAGGDADGPRDAGGDAARDASGDAEQDDSGSGDAAPDAKSDGGIVPPYGLAPIDPPIDD